MTTTYTATITPTLHERMEWARMAQDAYNTGRSFFGHRYSVHAATGRELPVHVFDTLQRHYRQWLIGGWAAVEAGDNPTLQADAAGLAVR